MSQKPQTGITNTYTVKNTRCFHRWICCMWCSSILPLAKFISEPVQSIWTGTKCFNLGQFDLFFVVVVFATKKYLWHLRSSLHLPSSLHLHSTYLTYYSLPALPASQPLFFLPQCLPCQGQIFPPPLRWSFLSIRQPHSQGLSSLPPLVIGRKTLVAAGHVTTCDTIFSTGIESSSNFCQSQLKQKEGHRIKLLKLHLWNFPVLL